LRAAPHTLTIFAQKLERIGDHAVGIAAGAAAQREE
jgi:phosphate uptake regulator